MVREPHANLIMPEPYLQGLKDALAAADAVGPTALACMATQAIRDLIQTEERRLAPIRRRNAQRAAALAPRRT